MPATAATRKADCHPYLNASQGTTAGAMSAPAFVPALKRLVAKARSRFGNQSVTALIAEGKLPPSPNPKAERAARKPPTLPTRACAAAAMLQAKIESA